MTLLREAIGESLRRARTAQSRTLREVSNSARVSLGYLSEVERGRKEASSELLAAICQALDLPLARVLSDVSTAMAEADDLAARAQREWVDAGPVGKIADRTRIVIPAPKPDKLVLVQAN
ncbi:helix-turn-helix domain-containing protein [Nocardia terpenica]|uniref:Helix-turn-helix domain-containing protein n=1 Tax=Nocardia terpenica TaxID=455432 RepID=A0A6G9Z758_9NOCA|nr:helix-turn-helix transcriptional regulator [Nocardia terpenica]QIS21445.1 helix-turn-helix domain-containing protein [Nocardia terpenica]